MRQSEPRTLGSGWISGVGSIVLGAMAFGAVLCLLLPAELTTPELRAVYPMRLIRGLIQAVPDSWPNPSQDSCLRTWSRVSRSSPD